MVLAIEELSALEDEIMSVLPDRITAILSKLNRSGRLEELLELLGMEDLLKQEQDFYSYKEGENCRCRWYGCKGRGITQYR